MTIVFDYFSKVTNSCHYIYLKLIFLSSSYSISIESPPNLISSSYQRDWTAYLIYGIKINDEPPSFPSYSLKPTLQMASKSIYLTTEHLGYERKLSMKNEILFTEHTFIIASFHLETSQMAFTQHYNDSKLKLYGRALQNRFNRVE